MLTKFRVILGFLRLFLAILGSGYGEKIVLGSPYIDNQLSFSKHANY